MDSNLGEIAISNFLKEGWLSEDSHYCLRA